MIEHVLRNGARSDGKLKSNLFEKQSAPRRLRRQDKGRGLHVLLETKKAIPKYRFLM
jgi:hypothetical protein